MLWLLPGASSTSTPSDCDVKVCVVLPAFFTFTVISWPGVALVNVGEMEKSASVTSRVAGSSPVTSSVPFTVTDPETLTGLLAATAGGTQATTDATATAATTDRPRCDGSPHAGPPGSTSRR